MPPRDPEYFVSVWIPLRSWDPVELCPTRMVTCGLWGGLCFCMSLQGSMAACVCTCVCGCRGAARACDSL